MYQLKLKVSKIKRKLRKRWYRMMKPLAAYINIKDDERNSKIEKSITREQAVKYIAKGILRELVKYPNSKLHFLVCDFYDREDFSGYDKIGRYDSTRYLKRKRERIALYKYAWDIDMQLKVLAYLSKEKAVLVTEEIETFSDWMNIRDYQGTYIVSVKV